MHQNPGLGGESEGCGKALVLVLVLVLHRGAVTVSSAGPRKLFKGMTTASSCSQSEHRIFTNRVVTVLPAATCA